jgi:radical SAM protein with 4Fe4S-binding SPASM domain
MKYPFFPFKMIKNGDEEFGILSPYKDSPGKINIAAAKILELCNGSRSIDQIVEELSHKFRTSGSEIADLADNFIHKMVGEGLVWVKEDKMRWYNPPPPTSIFWEITAECNLKCLHCVVSADKKLDGELTTEKCLRLIDEWARIGVKDITFSGGEPLIHKNFFDLAHAIRKRKLSAQLATNGTLITPEMGRELKKVIMSVQVSLDGSTAEVYGRVRGRKEAFDQAMRGIDILLQNGMDLTIGTVITTRNIDDIPNMLKLVEEHGIKCFRLIPFVPYGRGKLNQALELPHERVKEITTYLAQKRREVPFEILPLEFEETFQQPPVEKIDPSRPSECGGGTEYCTVTPDGEVLPCHYFEGVRADNVKDHPFSWIWAKSRFLNYFRSIRIKDIKGYCRECEWLPTCRAGCKAANFSHRAIFQSNCHCWIANENKKNRTQEMSNQVG